MIALDSSFLLAFFRDNDKWHNDAKTLMTSINNRDFGEAVITDYVFDEVMTWILFDTKNVSGTVKVGENLRESYKKLTTNEMLFEKAWSRFSSQKETRLSFTDCSIIETMANDGIKYLATFDKEFKRVNDIKTVGV